MTVIELFENCRSAVNKLDELNYQLNKIDLSGAPSGLHAQQYDAVSRGTNNHLAAKLQLYDGLCKQREELISDIAAMQDKMLPMLEHLSNIRARVILVQYYLQGETDQKIAASQHISRASANNIRHDALKQLCQEVSLT